MTQSSRSGGDNVTRDKSKLFAARLMQQGNYIEQALTRARVIDRIPEWAFDFSSVDSNSSSNNACTVAACKVFMDNGGTVPPLRVESKYRSLGGSGSAAFRVVPVQNVGSALDEVILLYPYISLDVCQEINRLAKITVDLSVIETFGGSVTDYSGNLTAIPSSGGMIGDQNTELIGQMTGCFQHNSAGYQFYYVVMAR